jgi:hypothetical protein
LFYFIGDHHVFVDGETGLLQATNDLRPGAVNPKPLKTRVADGNDDSFHSCDFTFRREDLGVRIPAGSDAKTSKNETMYAGRNVDTGTLYGNYSRISVV